MRIAWLVLVVVGCGSSRPPGAAVAAAEPGAPTASAPPAPPVAASPAPRSVSDAPATERRPVTDRYGDVKVVDDYRWLEDPKDPRVLAWTTAQNQRTRRRIDALPDRAKIHARVAELLSSTAPQYREVLVAGRGMLVLEQRPPKQQALLVQLTDPDQPRSERVVLDPNLLDPTGKTEIDFFVPSRDGKRVAISLSSGGSESGDVHVYDVATGKPLPDVVARVNGGTAGGSLAWNADGSGFWYTRYPHEGERPEVDLAFYQQVYFHKLGTPPAADAYVLGKELARISEIALRASPDGQSVLATVADGDGGDHELYMIDRGRTARVFEIADKIIEARFAPDGTLYVISRRGAPMGAVLRLARPYAGHPPELVVPAGDGVLNDLAPTASRLYVVELLGGPSRLRSYHLAAGKVSAPELVATPFAIATLDALRPIGDDDVLYVLASYTSAPGWYRYAARTRRSTPTAMVQPMTFAMDDVDVVREICKSADGTEVPINILHKHGIALDGSHPALLYGYGGYSINLTPRLERLSRLWIDQGGVYAVANLRGGNEFGEAWHDAGRLLQKQHVFDDFYACARALVERGYTRPERLAIQGASNGGLLMGAALTQHPEMYRAVVSGVGIYDSLRFELTPNGAFNITELGTVKDPDQLRALLAYSPYHHVTDGAAYPAILLTTGANDPRVDPYNSRKMAARLQAATSSSRPILLRASDDVGHGLGSPLDAVIEQASDTYAFLMSELGMRYTP